MNKKQGCYPQDELEHLGNGDLDKGIEEIRNRGGKLYQLLRITILIKNSIT